MAQLSTKISLYANSLGVSKVDFTKDVMLQDDSDGKGAYIKEWNLDIAQPTSDDLSAFDAAAETAEYNASQISKRVAEYKAENQIENIIEKGLEAEKSRVDAIKAKYPKK